MNKIKSIVSIVAVAFLIYIFTFYVDGEMGVILIAFLIAAPLFSLAFMLVGRNRISVDINCDGFVKKGSSLEVKVTVRKEGKLPLAFAEIVLSASEVFEKPKKTYRLSMISDTEQSFTVKIPAIVGGNGEVSVSSVSSAGFFGFMKLNAKNPLPEPKSVGVIPEIPEIKASSQLFRSIADLVMTSDEEEDKDTSMLISSNTMPGYEHREYVSGDPLKRINWKLSAKRDMLMVRLDEAASSVQPLLLLDIYRKTGSDMAGSVRKEEKLITSVFGLLTLLVKQGIACSFSYYSADGTLTVETVDSPEYPQQLLLKILAVKVAYDKRIALPQQNTGACACVIGTTDTGGSFPDIAKKAGDPESVSIIGVSRESGNPTELPMWYLDEDNTFKRV